MTSRERLLAVIQGKMPDRVPISTYELSGYNTKAFENNEPSYRNLMQLIREKTDCICMWKPASNESYIGTAYLPQQETIVTREGEIETTRTTITIDGKQLTRTLKVYDNVETIWQTEHICKDTDDVDLLMSLPFVPLEYDFSDYARIREEVGDHGIIMISVKAPVCVLMEMMEFGEATVWAVTETEHFQKTIDEIHRRTMINLENMLKKQVVELYRITGAEYITPPYLPKSYFERFVTPYIKDMVDLIHRYGGIVRVHSHGNIRDVVEEIISTGADGIDPCEPPPDGDIGLTELHAQVNGRVTLFGNLELKLLEHGTTEEVRNAVIECMESAKAGGRFVIMPTASPINLPLSPKTEENYRVFIETALEYGAY